MKSLRFTESSTCCGIIFAACATTASAAIVPYTEQFNSGAANWYNLGSTAVVDWVPSGGPDGSGYVTNTYNFINATAPFQPRTLFRAQDEFNSSNHAFEGNWVADNVTEVSYYIRHNGDMQFQFFTRFASPTNNPAGSHLSPYIPPNEWTLITFPLPDIDMVFEGPLTHEDVFSNIGHVQLGVITPALLVGDDYEIRVDIDQVGIAPEPATAGLVLAGISWFGFRNRRGRKTSNL